MSYTTVVDDDTVNAILSDFVDHDMEDSDYIDTSMILRIVSNKSLYDEIADDACSGGAESMIRSFCEVKMAEVVTAISYHTEELYEHLLTSEDSDIKELLARIRGEVEKEEEDD